MTQQQSSEFIDAYTCGQFTRRRSAEAFITHNLKSMRDHDKLFATWRTVPGFLNGYKAANNVFKEPPP